MLRLRSRPTSWPASFAFSLKISVFSSWLCSGEASLRCSGVASSL
jgi:hypothetical protein